MRGTIWQCLWQRKSAPRMHGWLRPFTTQTRCWKLVSLIPDVTRGFLHNWLLPFVVTRMPFECWRGFLQTRPPLTNVRADLISTKSGHSQSSRERIQKNGPYLLSPCGLANWMGLFYLGNYACDFSTWLAGYSPSWSKFSGILSAIWHKESEIGAGGLEENTVVSEQARLRKLAFMAQWLAGHRSGKMYYASIYSNPDLFEVLKFSYLHHWWNAQRTIVLRSSWYLNKKVW